MRLRGGLALDEIERLYRRSYPVFVRTASAITGDRRAGEDAVQEAFVAAVRERRRFRGSGRPEAWLWTIVLNCARERRRRLRDESGGDEDQPPAMAQEESARKMLVREAVERLPERQRLAIFLRYYADLDYETIARVLGVRRGTVSATLHSAHATLRGALLEVD